jgi:hypothetical protein
VTIPVHRHPQAAEGEILLMDWDITISFLNFFAEIGTNEKARQPAGHLTDITIKVWLRGQDLNL